ncbi:MAG: T9SS C-terminal target domain-containing protein [Bacteroidetes bacterium]|nr:MAG: T9SS C-terminal target domain-containing protein [Bacteroidota bacterium]REK00718.1 MAG: T9SS C-terminal target domain-containing protein [Bacteroidota bacterium]REK35160.1 MAG: T9SS C-terminal target domain-containing protein [Bacteroidota bacterium]REK48237.1 MAG: T9SS C-terminal target domain-containing protein [Bacteroidota bacterium]
MKKQLLSFLMILFATSMMAQTSGGPDNFGYTWKNSNDPSGPTYNWIDITTLPSAVQVTGLGDDNTVGFFPIGFNFQYYWYTVNQFKIGSNGYLIFGSGQLAPNFPVIPSPAQPHDFLAAMLTDLNFAGTGNVAECWYWTNQADTLVVSFINVPFWINATPPYTGFNTFQFILTSTDSSITYQYFNQSGTSPGTTSPVVSSGFENNSGSDGLTILSDVYPTANTAVKIFYPDSITAAINDASTVFSGLPASGATFLSKDGNSIPMQARIKNTGNQAWSPFNVDMRIIDENGIVQIQETLTSSALAAGQTEDLVSTTVFNPTTAGRYTQIVNTMMPGDLVSTNNAKYQEIVVVDTTTVDIALSYTGSVAVPPSTGISWSGGNAGVGVEIVPPFYPCYVRKLEFFITSNSAATGFYALIYDNGGPDGTPGNLLDSIFVSGGQVLYPNLWNTVFLANPILIDSGSVFIEWRMQGSNIALGTDETLPVSNRSYETLGGWAIFRDRELRDPMIRALVATSPTSGVLNANLVNLAGEFYPSPSSGKMSLDINLEQTRADLKFEVYNVQGKKVYSRELKNSAPNGFTRLDFDFTSLGSGLFVCKITSGDVQINRNFILAD